MEILFETPALKEPEAHEILWRFIRPCHVKSFLEGGLYFAQLTQFNDFYEAITPMHYLLISMAKRSINWKCERAKSGIESFLNQFKNLWTALDWNLFLTQFRLITGIAYEAEDFWPTITHLTENLEGIYTKHRKTQESFYSSCWFIGDFDESAMMWQCYSEPGGVAVRTTYERLKSNLKIHFENLNRFELQNGIKKVITGKVEYHKYALIASWVESMTKGVPLPFFKHDSFKNENEFRIVLEKEAGFSNEFQQKQNIFHANLDDFRIILHPSSQITDIEKLKQMSSYSYGLNILMSELSYRLIPPQLLKTEEQ